MNLERLFSIFRISASGLSAQRKYIETTTSNIANIETTETQRGGPYIPRRIRFREIRVRDLFGRMVQQAMTGNRGSVVSQGSGLTSLNRKNRVELGSRVQARKFLENKNPTKTVYEPENPDADENGYVQKPNINLVKEMTNLMVATRAYEANVTALNAAKDMMKKALQI